MAAVVSHAMRRFPPTPPDVYSSYELRVSLSVYIAYFGDYLNGREALSIKLSKTYSYSSYFYGYNFYLFLNASTK